MEQEEEQDGGMLCIFSLLPVLYKVKPYRTLVSADKLEAGVCLNFSNSRIRKAKTNLIEKICKTAVSCKQTPGTENIVHFPFQHQQWWVGRENRTKGGQETRNKFHNEEENSSAPSGSLSPTLAPINTSYIDYHLGSLLMFHFREIISTRCMLLEG